MYGCVVGQLFIRLRRPVFRRLETGLKLDIGNRKLEYYSFIGGFYYHGWVVVAARGWVCVVEVAVPTEPD